MADVIVHAHKYVHSNIKHEFSFILDFAPLYYQLEQVIVSFR